jgi:pyroglutamyl-peptidase
MVLTTSAASVSQSRVLLTGFDPFGGDSANPSWLAAQALHGRQIAGYRVIAAQLPTVFGQSIEVLRALLDKHRPALVICLGQAGGRAALSLERVAINIDDARIADNEGGQPIDMPVSAKGPVGYFSTLPIKAMMLAIRDEGVAAEVSQSAGTFVCNHLFYGLMQELHAKRVLEGTRGGFIHVPWLPEQGTPSMTLEDMVRGLRAAVHCALQTASDVTVGAGTEH